jgi:hypothetical protein
MLALLIGLAGTARADEKSSASKPAASKPPAQVQNFLFPHPPPGYERHVIRGFVLWIGKDVISHNDDPKFRLKPLDVLDRELETIVEVMYDKAVDKLRTILIWVDWDKQIDGPNAPPGGAVAFYLGGNQFSARLQQEHGARLNAVNILSMLELTLEHQPFGKGDPKKERLERCVILHEMAHAVHHRVIGYDNADDQLLKSIYQLAMGRGLYRQVKDAKGNVVKDDKGAEMRPYASVNHHEYFAELSCAYLDHLWYYPFDWKDLKEYDRDGYAVMEKIWGKTKAQRVAEEEAKKGKAKSPTTAQAAPEKPRPANTPNPPTDNPDRAEKAAASRLKQAKSLLEEGKKGDAREYCEDILKRYPKTKAADDARQLLEELKK